MQGGCNEISNIKLTPGSSATTASDWEEKVRISRTKMFKLAQSSLKNNPNLKKVIIVKSLPRYDPQPLDPNSIKAKLNQFGNTLYDTLWMQNSCPSNIKIVDQHMDCQGPLREKRFGNPVFMGHDGKPWDGIHMRGRLAVRHFTNSFIRILSELSPSMPNQSNYHDTCPQALYKSRQQDNYNPTSNYQYQRSRHNNRDGYYNRDSYNGQQQAGRSGYNRHFNTQHFDNKVSVSNRFSPLGNF